MVSNEIKNEIRKLEGPIVVFGAGGFVGANLFREILAVRNDCFAVTHQRVVPWRLSSQSVNNILHADLRDKTSVKAIFDRHAFKTIFNCAGYGGYSKQADIDTIYGTNIQGLADLLEIATEKGFSAFVEAGSSSEYGLNSGGSKEASELMPNSHYSVSKIAASFLIKYFGAVKKAPVIHLRLFSVYGPYEEQDRLIPTLIDRGLKGSYSRFVDPDISRDLVYVDDVVEAMVLSATIGVKKAPGASVNIASGKKTTIKEIASLSKELFGLKGEPSFGSMPNRPWDHQKDWFGDPAFAKEALNWHARTSFKEGLQKTIDWQKKEGAKLPGAYAAEPLSSRKISAVIACYRDAQAIPIMYDRLKQVFGQLGILHEIIFVNDASPDNTNEVLNGILSRDKSVIAIEHSRNFGSQSAFLSGMQAASGDAVVLLDGDLQDPPELIEEFYKKWQEGYDVVYGRRIKRQASWLLSLCYKVFYRLFRGMSYIPMPLDAGDFSLLDRKVVNELIKLPETDQFLRGLRAWVGFKQTGVDYLRPERMFGVTTNNWRKNIWWAKKAIFSFSFIPLELLSYFGVFLFIVSVIALVGQVIARIMLPNIPQGVSTIIVLVLFFGAVQVLAISVIGEYLMKIFEETKKRPKFIRRSIRTGGKDLESPEEIEKFITAQRGG